MSDKLISITGVLSSKLFPPTMQVKEEDIVVSIIYSSQEENNKVKIKSK
jgi:hypothetical protein